MGTIGQPITPSIPTVGTPGPQFATDINAILTEVVARLTTQVPLASLALNTDLNLSGSALLNAGFVTLANSPGSPASSPVNRLTAFSGDLFYVSPSGAVQITTGATLNAAAVGGITGDYGGANPAQFRMDAVNARYDAYANFGTGTWANIRAVGFDIAANSTSLVFARLRFAGVANKTYTFPAAAATTNTRPLYIDSSGQLIVGHGTKRFSYGVVGANFSGGASALSGDGGIINTTTSAVQGLVPISGLLTESVITEITFNFSKTTTSATQFLLKKAVPGGAAATLATLNTITIGAGQAVSVALSETVPANGNYYVQYQSSSGIANSDTWFGFQLSMNLPA